MRGTDGTGRTIRRPFCKRHLMRVDLVDEVWIAVREGESTVGPITSTCSNEAEVHVLAYRQRKHETKHHAREVHLLSLAVYG